MSRDAESADVVILGGGLAGLTLALQLKQRFVDLEVAVIERRQGPAPTSTHKVGESSVELAANYFDTVLGLREHLVSQQLKKFGFRFFFSDARKDIDSVLEMGSGRYLSTPAYQIDRGSFENFLAERVQAVGVRLCSGATVREIALGSGDDPHVVQVEIEGAQRLLSANWLLDASGRAGLLKRHLGLALPSGHDVNSVWFRIGARIAVDQWSDDPGWVARCEKPLRWLSTSHLVGDGYWVWLIPLASGSHSVGIVADGGVHRLSQMNSFDKALHWLHERQPKLAEDIESKRDLLQDFGSLKGLSYDCKQLFSGDRWAITGEAGVFLDPFYSPGSDFIAISNTFITELVAADRAGAPVPAYARMYESLLRSFIDSTMSLYKGQYGLFGDPEVLPVKVIWDYTYYWGVLCQLFFQRRLTDLRMYSRLDHELAGSRVLNETMQRFLRQWSSCSARRNRAAMLDQGKVDWIAELNRGLLDPLDDESFDARIRQTTTQLGDLAREIVETACREHPGLNRSEIDPLLMRYRSSAGAGGMLETA
jgi:flavin-dependent dehydrogenase